MATWTEEDKNKVIAAYKAAGPTPENSTEIVKQIAEDMDQSPNGVRMILSQAGVYVKKEAAGKDSKNGEKSSEGSKRVPKEASIKALADAITAIGAEVDQEILDKLTGKAAVYFTKVLSAK